VLFLCVARWLLGVVRRPVAAYREGSVWLADADTDELFVRGADPAWVWHDDPRDCSWRGVGAVGSAGERGGVLHDGGLCSGKDHGWGGSEADDQGEQGCYLGLLCLRLCVCVRGNHFFSFF